MLSCNLKHSIDSHSTCTNQKKSLKSCWLLDTSLQTLPTVLSSTLPTSALLTRHTSTLYHGWHYYQHYNCRQRCQYQCYTCFRDRSQWHLYPEDYLQSPAFIQAGGAQNRELNARASNLVSYLPIYALHLYTNNNHKAVVPMASH